MRDADPFDEFGVDERRAEVEHQPVAHDDEEHRHQFQAVDAVESVGALLVRQQLADVGHGRERHHHVVAHVCADSGQTHG